MKTLFTWMLLIVLSGTAYSQPGNLDLTFSHDGKQTAGTGIFEGAAVTIDTYGRIVVSGDDANGSFKACRFKPNGLLDNSFGSNGIAAVQIFTPFSGYDLLAHGGAVQRDNKTLIVGDDAQGSFSHGYIARLNADGTPDSSFGYGNAYSYAGSRPRSVVVQPDGKIVTAGYAAYTSNSTTDRDKFQVTRLNTDGTGDNTFGINGQVAFSFTKGSNETYDEAYSVAIQPDGKIVVAGISDGDNSRFAIARLLSNGTLDKTFGKDGETVTQVVGYSQYEMGTAVTLQPDGKILLAGTYYNKDHLARGAVVRYLTNGLPDTTYGDHGKVLLRFPNSSVYHHVTSIAMQPNGKAIIGGYIASDSYTSNAQFALASINADGTLDTAFGSGGIAGTQIGNFSVAYGVAVQSDGKIVEGGSADNKFAAARFIGEGTAPLMAASNTEFIKPAINSRIANNETYAASLKVYPNPVANTATITFAGTGKYTLQLSDMSGNLLMIKTGIANKGMNTIPLNMSRYAAGSYVLVLRNEQQQEQTFNLSKQ